MIPRRRSGWRSTNGAPGMRRAPGTNRGFLRQQNTLRDALVASINLNIFARHADRVRMATIAQMVNVLQAMILTDGEKMVLTPTYHVFEMYMPFQDATVLPVTFDAGNTRTATITLPRVDAIAARDQDGKLWLSLTNLDPTRPADIRHAARRHHGEIGARRDADGAGGRQRQHVRGAEHGCRRSRSPRRSRAPVSVTLAPKSVTVLVGAPMSPPAAAVAAAPESWSASPCTRRCRRSAAAGRRRQAGDRRAHQGSRRRPRGQSRRQRRRPRRARVPAAELSTRSRGAIPVVYALHGYSIGAEQWSKEIHVPQTIEGAFAQGARR